MAGANVAGNSAGISRSPGAPSWACIDTITQSAFRRASRTSAAISFKSFGSGSVAMPDLSPDRNVAPRNLSSFRAFDSPGGPAPPPQRASGRSAASVGGPNQYLLLTQAGV